MHEKYLNEGGTVCYNTMMKEIDRQYPDLGKLKPYSDYCTYCFDSYKNL